MSDLAEDLRSFLLAAPAIAGVVDQRVHQDHVPQQQARPYIWYRQSGVEEDSELDGAVGAEPERVFFDVECCAPISQVAKNLAKLVRGKLNNLRGMLGAQRVLGVFVREHDDDYVPRNGGDPGLHIAVFVLEIVPA